MENQIKDKRTYFPPHSLLSNTESTNRLSPPTMNHHFNIPAFLFVLLFLHSATAATPLPPPSAACSDELVTFTTCLPYVSVSPNNLTDFPPPQCCDDVSAAFSFGSAVCLCYFLIQPEILGFPLNSTKLMSLTSICPLKDSNSKANFSLETLCSESTVLPPLQSITGPTLSKPHHSGSHSLPPPLLTGSPLESSDDSSLPPEPADELPTQPGSSTTAIVSSATKGIHNLDWAKILPIKVTFLFSIFTCV